MTSTGLVGVPDPSELFGRTHAGEVGAAVACALEGTRPILLEIQSLVSKTDLAMPRRVGTGRRPEAAGDDRGRALAPRRNRARVGRRLRQRRRRGADRRARRRSPVALAIASAARGVPVRDGTASFGEIGLTGRLRPAAQAERRLEECAKLRIGVVIAPEGTKSHDGQAVNGARVTRAETLRQAIAAGLEAVGGGGRAVAEEGSRSSAASLGCADRRDSLSGESRAVPPPDTAVSAGYSGRNRAGVEARISARIGVPRRQPHQAPAFS